MFGGNQPQGFTVIEVIIFLGVSGLLFLSVLGLISNQQNKTEFFQGIHEFDTQIQNISNDVQVGYYADYNDFTCTDALGAPSITLSPVNSQNNQGSNTGCAFIGHVVQFAPTNLSNTQYTVYTVVGRQFAVGESSSLIPVSNLTEAEPVTIGGGTNNPIGNATADAQTFSLPPGLSISSVSYVDNSSPGTKKYESLIGFFSSFPSLDSSAPSATLYSGSSTSELIPIPSNPNGAGNPNEFVDQSSVSCYVGQIQNTSGNAVSVPAGSPCPSADTYIDPTEGVVICLQSSGLSGIYGIIKIGANSTSVTPTETGNPLSVQLSTGSVCP